MIKKIIPESKIKRFFFYLFIFLVLTLIIYQILAYRKKPEKIDYGVSFNVPYAIELGLDWKETYLAIMDDLGFKRLRLAAHWPLVEPQQDEYDFSYLDFQLEEAAKRNVDVILVIGRRVPRWPECHVPKWASKMDDSKWQNELLDLMEKTVLRYRHYDNISYWQIENEPFLEFFAYEHCGDLDVDFLDKQIGLVRALDPDRPILMTDSGNVGKWAGAYSRGDAFGTSVYLYFWNPFIGRFKSILPASFYRVKTNWSNLRHGKKEVFLIELSLEPWLIKPLIQTSVETQLEVMDLKRMKKIIQYADRTYFDKQYLWGAEWWYWLKVEHQMPEKWDYVKDLIRN